MTQPEDTEAALGTPSGARWTIHILAAALVVVVLPAVLVDIFVGVFAANALLLGLFLGVVGSMVGGTRRMVYLAVPFGVAAGLGAFTAYGWWWVALLALLGLIAGAGIGFGWLPPLLVLPLVATFASPMPSGLDAVGYAAFATIGVFYGLVLARRFKAPQVIDGQRVSVGATAAVAVVLAVAVGGAAAIGVALGWAQPYWVPEPILILSLSIVMDRKERVREKAFATAVGVIVAVPVALLAPPTWVIYDHRLCGIHSWIEPTQEELLALLQLVHVCARPGSRAARAGRCGGGASRLGDSDRNRRAGGRLRHPPRTRPVAGQTRPRAGTCRILSGRPPRWSLTRVLWPA